MASDAAAKGGNAEREGKLIEMLIATRLEARAAKNFAQADAIRKSLAEIGVLLEDGSKGTSYKIQ